MTLPRLAAAATVCVLLTTACAAGDDPSAEQVRRAATASETADAVETPSARPSATQSATPSAVATPSATPPAASATPDAVEIEIEIEDGEVRTASDRVRVTQGEQVRIEAESDVADELHLHGYDIETPIGPGQAGVMAFTADQVGVFELETHDSGLLLLQLEVR